MYGYTNRPPMPDRFIPGQITTPRGQLPRAVGEEVKSDRPSQLFGWPQSVGVITDNAEYVSAADTSEHVLKTLTFLPGTIYNLYGGFRFKAGGQCTGSGGVKTLTLTFGGITIATLSVSTGLRSWLIEGEVWNNASTREQRWHVKCWDGQSPGIESMNVSGTTSLSVEMM